MRHFHCDKDKITSGAMHIRPLTLRDLPSTHKIAKEIFPAQAGSVLQAHMASLLPKALIAALTPHLMPSPLTRLDTYVAIKKATGGVIGFGGHYVLRDFPREIWCGWFGIAPQFCGYGHGGSFLADLLTKAQHKDDERYDLMRLWTTARAETLKARRLYESFGFKKTEILALYPPNEKGHQVVVYSINLKEEVAPSPLHGFLEDVMVGADPQMIRAANAAYDRKMKASNTAALHGTPPTPGG